MEVTRILSLIQFDGNRGRFSNVVFKHVSGEAVNTPDGKLGISVVENDCPTPRLEGDRVCEYIARFYDPPFPQPCAFWIFDTDILNLEQGENGQSPLILSAPSTSGDPCHRNIHHLGNSRAQKIFDRKFGLGLVGLCNERRCEPFTEIRALELKMLALSRLPAK